MLLYWINLDSATSSNSYWETFKIMSKKDINLRSVLACYQEKNCVPILNLIISFRHECNSMGFTSIFLQLIFIGCNFLFFVFEIVFLYQSVSSDSINDILDWILWYDFDKGRGWSLFMRRGNFRTMQFLL